ncbi:YbaB/EbfC family nucleoid-associated protein [Nocardia colli]|uniref:YbaB/EbfC family nucleoid-associated protein n=1 Tax=Nocardia colli TaxID=2545717 RepID=UPI0035DB377D
MDQWRLDGLRSIDNGLRRQVDHIWDAFEQLRERATEVRAQLAELRVRATSADGLVEVTVDARGMVTDARITVGPVRTTSAALQRSVIEAAQSAAARAREQSAALVQPISVAAEELPDLRAHVRPP